jgi:hypothetical protein
MNSRYRSPRAQLLKELSPSDGAEFPFAPTFFIFHLHQVLQNFVCVWIGPKCCTWIPLVSERRGQDNDKVELVTLVV